MPQRLPLHSRDGGDKVNQLQDDEPFDLVETCIQALVLYSLAEFQAGQATTLRVMAREAAFGISDDGRGHSLDKVLEGTSYLRFVYTHFEYPFASPRGAPVQLQGIGMSLVNALCNELTVTVRKRSESMTLSFRNGRLHESATAAAAGEGTGISIQGRLRPGLGSRGCDTRLEPWLRSLVQVHPTLKLFLNGRELLAGIHDGSERVAGPGE